MAFIEKGQYNQITRNQTKKRLVDFFEVLCAIYFLYLLLIPLVYTGATILQIHNLMGF